MNYLVSLFRNSLLFELIFMNLDGIQHFAFPNKRKTSSPM